MVWFALGTYYDASEKKSALVLVSLLKSILFFEPEIKGHQLDYIEHLCNYYVKFFDHFRLFRESGLS